MTSLNSSVPLPRSPSSQSVNQSGATAPQIRLAGRAHVRGKIRRVWRPRYLELYDNGLVRYYELNSQSSSSSASRSSLMEQGSLSDSWTSSANPLGGASQKQSAKYTLQIFHARILDVTTLRDMHVGLPRGSYGFVFRGQRLLGYEQQQIIPSATSSGAVSTPLTPNTTGRTTTSALSPPHQKQQQRTSIGHIVPMAYNSNIPTSTSGGGGNPSADLEQRDFLCAVSSLEDAQMWVVALQWAASEWCSPVGNMAMSLPMPSSPAPMQSFAQPSSVSQTTDASGYWKQTDDTSTVATPTVPSAAASSSIALEDWDHVEEAEGRVDSVGILSMTKNARASSSLAPSVVSSSSSMQTQTGASFVNVSTASLPPTTKSSGKKPPVPPLPPQGPSAPSQSSSPASSSAAASKTSGTTTTSKGGAAKMLVTKVTRLATVRVSTMQWEVAYEIHGLLLVRSTSITGTVPHAEVWTVWRTAQELQALVTQLQPSSRLEERARLLPRLHPAQHQPLKSWAEWQASVTNFDQILQGLVTQAQLLNTLPLRKFLGLFVTSESASKKSPGGAQYPPHPSPLCLMWQKHSSPTTPITRQRIYHPSDDPYGLSSSSSSQKSGAPSTPDQFVKEWMLVQEREQAAAMESAAAWFDSCVTLVLQRPFAFFGVSSVALWPMVRLWQQSQTSVLPRVTLRVDYLVLSWMGAAYLGGQFLAPAAAPATSNSSTRSRSKTSTQPNSNRTKESPSMSGGVSRESPVATGIKPYESHVMVETPQDENQVENVVVEPGSAEDDSEGEEEMEDSPSESLAASSAGKLSSPIPEYPANNGTSCFSRPKSTIFNVRSITYLKDRVKEPSGPAPLTCRGIDVWMTDNPERHIARHPSVLGGKLAEKDTFLVNFLLPFGNFVAYFAVPPLTEFPQKLRSVWIKFLKGDQQYRDARLKLLPVVMEGPWIVKAAVGPGKSPALLGKVIPLQYFFREPDSKRRGVYEVDVIITASSIAKGILSVVKGNTKSVSLAFAFIIEAAEQEELPETILCSFQIHALNLEDCPILPPCNLDEIEDY